jgi:hypothetical protein
MTIREFIKTIKEVETPVAELIATKRYIPSAEKIRIAKAVIDFSVEYDRSFVKFDSFAKHLSFIFNVVEAHTDLKFADDWAERMQEYNILCENDLLNAIIDTFRKDYEASLEVLEMMCNELLVDNSIEASVAKVAQSIAENLDVFVGTLSDKLEKIDIEKIIPKNLDLNKLQEFLRKFK